MKETTLEKSVQDKLEELGFGVQDTGGGFQQLRKDLCNGLYLAVTNGEGELPDTDAQLYLMTDLHSDPIAQSAVMSPSELLLLIEDTLK